MKKQQSMFMASLIGGAAVVENTTEYSNASLIACSIEAGKASAAIETAMFKETAILDAKAESGDVELIAQSVFGKDGFIGKIIAKIAAAFRAIGNFIAQLFGKLTKASEKNLKNLKERYAIFMASSKIQTILNGGPNTVRFKAQSYVKTKAYPVAQEILFVAVAAGSTQNDPMVNIRVNPTATTGVTVNDFFETTVENYINALAAGTAVPPAVSTNLVNQAQAIATGYADVPVTADKDKAVKVWIAKAIQEASSAARVQGQSGIATILHAPANQQVLKLFGADKKWNPGDIKSLKDPKGDYIAWLGEMRGRDARIEDVEIAQAVAVVGHMCEWMISEYDNLKKFFQTGKERFMSLADRYDDIAKDFKGDVEAAQKNTDPAAQNSQSAANAVYSAVQNVTGISQWFTDVSLASYSVMDAVTFQFMGDVTALLNNIIDAFETNTVEVV